VLHAHAGRGSVTRDALDTDALLQILRS